MTKIVPMDPLEVGRMAASWASWVLLAVVVALALHGSLIWAVDLFIIAAICSCAAALLATRQAIRVIDAVRAMLASILQNEQERQAAAVIAQQIKESFAARFAKSAEMPLDCTGPVRVWRDRCTGRITTLNSDGSLTVWTEPQAREMHDRLGALLSSR